jgi:hypothetical protein
MNYEGFDFNQTCGACPEQYDVQLNGETMAYLRLRHGYFYAAVPDCGGEIIYSAHPEGDGMFECGEREKYLREALAAIIQHYYQEGEISDSICCNCKTHRWTQPTRTLIKCRECSPYHGRFHTLLPNYNTPMNSLFVIEPKRNKYGIWAFDDESTGLVNEPFVGETNDLIDAMVREKGIKLKSAANGIAVVFSALPFPGSQCELVLNETSPSGTTYSCDKFHLTPWLCPAFFKYFPKAPDRLYAMIKIS